MSDKITISPSTNPSITSISLTELAPNMTREEVRGGFEPGAQPGGKPGVGGDRKVAVAQHIQWIVVHGIPPSSVGYCARKARRARTSKASVACTVRPISSAHSGTEQSSR